MLVYCNGLYLSGLQKKKKERKQTYDDQRGKTGRINHEFGINTYILLYVKQINKDVLLYSTGDHIQYLIITFNGKESEKE